MTERRLKVVRAIARLNIGGPARQAILLHTSLRGRGVDTVLVHGAVGAGEADLEDLLPPSRDGVAAIRCLRSRIHPLDDVRALVALGRIVFRERPDVVHTHTAKAGALGRVAALAYNLTRPRARRCAVVHTFHGHVFEGYFGPLGSAAVLAAERLLGGISDRIVTISSRQREAIVERFRVAPADRVSVIPLGLDLDPFFAVEGTSAAFRGELGFPPDAFLVGCVGRLVRIKDIGLLIDAVDMAASHVPSLRLAVVGDGSERAALERHVRERGLAARVVFTGWRRDLPEIYAGLDAVALSSRNEGTPVALIEAMAAGRPVVAAAVGGVPDLVEDEVSGILVPPGRAPALADALVRLAHDGGACASFGRSGREAARRFEASRLIEALDALYRSELERVRSGS